MNQPNISKKAVVFPGARIVGNVTVEDGCGIWYNAVLRGDMTIIRIGKDSNIQDGVVVHGGNGYNTTVGNRVSVGHNAVLHGCTVEDNVTIGMGAVLLNGSHIGANSMVAAGSLVTQGKTFPAGMLIVGSPAKAVRPLTPEEIKGMEENTEYYCNLLKNNYDEVTYQP